MSNYLTYNPTNAQIAAQQNGQGVANPQQIQYGLDGFLFASGLQAGALENAMIYKFWDDRGMFFMHTLLQSMEGTYQPVASQAIEWREFGKVRVGEQVVGTPAVGAATTTVELNTELTRVFVGMVLMSPRGINFIIEGVTPGSTGNNTEILVRKTDGTNIAANELTADDVLGINHTLFAEDSDAPVGQTWLPENKANYLGVGRRSCNFTGHALTDRTEVKLPDGSSTWVTHDILVTLMELKKDMENMVMWSREKATNANGGTAPRGMVPDIQANANNQVLYTTFAETDLQQLILNTNNQNGSREYLLCQGQGQHRDTFDVLKPYHIDGSLSYGAFSGEMGAGIAAGLNVKSYNYMGKTLNLHHYQNFDNTDELGNAGAASATVTNYTDFGLLLNVSKNVSMASVPGTQYGPGKEVPALTLFYKQLGNTYRGFVWGYERGMTGSNGMGVAPGGGPGGYSPDGFANNQVASGKDRDSMYFLFERGLRVVNVETGHGVMRKNG